jgi:hypothetical protein
MKQKDILWVKKVKIDLVYLYLLVSPAFNCIQI